MPRHCSLSLMLMSILLLAGCAADDSPEALVEEIADHIEEMNGILANVNDAESAKAASPRLKQLHDRWQEIEVQLKDMDEPDDATLQRIDDVYESRIADSVLALMENVHRLSRQQGVMDELEDALPFTGG